MLDAFVAITGYHRKHAIRLLSKPAAEPQKRCPRTRYGAKVRDNSRAVDEGFSSSQPSMNDQECSNGSTRDRQ